MQLLYDECRLLLKFHPGIFNEIMTKVLSTGSRTKNQGRDLGLQWTAPTHEQYSSTVEGFQKWIIRPDLAFRDYASDFLDFASKQ